MITQNAPALIPVLYLISSMIIPMLGYFRAGASYYVALLTSVVVFGISLMGLQEVMANGTISYHLGGWMPPVGIELVLDPLSAFISVIITGSALIVMVYARTNVAHEVPGSGIGFYSLSMLFMGGLAGMTITGDFFNLFVFLEISALASYGLLAIGTRRGPVSAFRYLVLGTAGAIFYLMGVGFILIATGSLNMVDVGNIIPYAEYQRPVIIGLVLILLGIVIKMGVFPLHHWLPDAYTDASSTATALIAPIGTKVAAYVLIRVMTIYEFPPLLDALTWLAALSIIVGSILAIAQPNIKRMLAYSSVANIGYITLGVALANPIAYIGAMLHILMHAMMKALLFMSAGGILNKMGTLNIARLRGFPSVMPWTALAFFIGVLSMVGIPPTGGFFSKLYLIWGAIEAEAWIFVAVILLSTLLGFVYLFRLVNIAFFRPYEKSDDKKVLQSEDLTLDSPVEARDESRKEFESMPGREMGIFMLIPVLILAAALIVVGFYNGIIVDNVISLSIPEILQSAP